MGLFGNRKPKLANYSGVGLDALLQDPEWAYPISQAGIKTSNCEIVLHLSDSTIGLGLSAGAPVHASPAILFGQGTTLAMAYPTEREVTVVRRDTARAELQTQRSGWFQILFGPANNLDGFMFWGGSDNLQLGTPEGEKFGQIMSAFLAGKLKPQQVVGTPQSLAASAVSVEPPAPEFEDPEDALRWKMVHAVQTALAEMMDRYQECFEKAEKVEKAFGLANAEVVDGVQHHPISRENFRKMGVKLEEELARTLAELRERTSSAASQWKDLVFLMPAGENDIMKIGNWCMSHGVSSETSSALISNGAFIHTDFGLTRESFWTENERVLSVLNRSAQ
jgi:hypothetical protein